MNYHKYYPPAEVWKGTCSFLLVSTLDDSKCLHLGNTSDVDFRAVRYFIPMYPHAVTIWQKQLASKGLKDGFVNKDDTVVMVLY